jgi:hypothetical protein
MAITVHTYSMLLGAGGAALALWTVTRFPRVRPTGIAVAAVNVVVAYVGGMWLASILTPFFAGFPVGGSLALAAVGGALPVIVYFFVSIAWLIRCLQGMLMPAR